MQNIIYLESYLKMPLMPLHVRSTYVKIGNKGILISPGSKLTESDYQKLDVVTDIVGTNFYHCGGIKKAAQFFPNAKIWGPPGAQAYKNEITFTDEISEQNWPYANELPFLLVKGMPKFNEVVFFHKESGSLIVSDLCFNLLDAKGLGAKIILSLFGSYQRFAMSKLFLKNIKDMAAFKNSMQQILKWDFSKIVVSHGRVVENNGKNIFQNELQRLNLI